MKCAALGCQKAPGRSGLFCASCWRRLPEDLRGPAAAKQAVVYLGMTDGYLIDYAPRVNVSDADPGRGYV